MTLFVINIGETGYAKDSLFLINKLCAYNKIKLFVLNENITQNIYGLHPSWLKLFCHDIVDDDFIICWDLDLVPCKLYDLKQYFNFDNLNFCFDGSFIHEKFNFNGKFKYNCGLIGVPKKFKNFLKTVYFNNAYDASYPSYEQYYINDYIFDLNINPNVLPEKLNFMYNGTDNFEDELLNIHYTWKIKSKQHRIELIKKHKIKYKINFGNKSIRN